MATEAQGAGRRSVHEYALDERRVHVGTVGALAFRRVAQSPLIVLVLRVAHRHRSGFGSEMVPEANVPANGTSSVTMRRCFSQMNFSQTDLRVSPSRLLRHTATWRRTEERN